jgi:hypothetical protein
MSRQCIACVNPISKRSRSGLCRSCALRRRPRQKRGVAPKNPLPRVPCATAGCGETIAKSPRRATDICKSCLCRAMARDPDNRARVAASMRARHADPAFRELHRERTTAGMRRLLSEDPEFLAKRREMGRQMGLLGMGVQRLPAGHPVRLAAGRKISETKMAWCPPSFRDRYFQLVGKGGLSAADGRALILAEVKEKAAALNRGKWFPQSEFIAIRSAQAYLVEHSL